MAGEGSNKRSKRSKKRAARRQPATVNLNTVNANRERTNTNTLRLIGDGVDRVPSNAPTMAIAPSDYEHIFHEGPGGGGGGASGSPARESAGRGRSGSASPATPPQLPQRRERERERERERDFVLPQPAPQMVPSPPPPPLLPMASPRMTADQVQEPPARAYAADVQVTPDGYTLLGHPVDPAPAQRRMAPLPPHVVRASNQFSRAALARVARYLASRGDR